MAKSKIRKKHLNNPEFSIMTSYKQYIHLVKFVSNLPTSSKKGILPHYKSLMDVDAGTVGTTCLRLNRQQDGPLQVI